MSVPGIPDEEDEATREPQNGSRRSTICSDQEPKARPKLSEYVDKLELALSNCLSDYRAQAEDVLAEHLTALEDIQTAYEHELAGMQLENQTLRGRLGLKGPDDVQKVLFQTARTAAMGGRRPSRGGRPQLVESESPKNRVSTVKSKVSIHSRRNATPLPGGAGTWQAFMAWVPSGAALGSPTPWKALEDQSPGPLPPQRRKMSTGSTGPDKSFAAVVPECAEKPGKQVMVDVLGQECSDTDSDETRTIASKEEFEVLPIFQASEKLARKLKKHNKSEAASSAVYREEEADFGQQVQPWYILNPDSLPRVLWDVFSLFMITYDMIFVPLEVCFNPAQTTFLESLDWTTRFFWTFDMGMSCITGFVFADGVIQYNQREILRHYARTWFLPDVAIVSWDWIGYMVSGGGLALGQLARAVRVARAVRLLRLLRMQEVLANLTERLQSDVLEVIMQILKLVVILVVTCHFLACFWWAVGTNGTETVTWVKAGGYDDYAFDSSYLVCLYWAISLFCGGAHSIYPETDSERFYGVASGLLSFVLMLVMFGTLTSGLTQRHIIDGSGQRQLATLKSYLRQNNLPKNLMKRLLRNAKHAISGDLNADAVQLLTVISEPLKIQMHFEMYSRILHYHPLFRDLLSDGNALVRRMCHQAMGMLLLASGDAVFEVEEEPAEPKMYFVVTGMLEYVDENAEVHSVHEKGYLAEAVLWTRWRHRGTLSATSDVKLAMLDANGFQDICKQAISKKHAACLPVMAYAQEFVRELNRTRPSDLPEKRRR